ncbi:unnamed protein product [Trifolium pratense]|uniref:Uncharacterized protein n=3 Tax=Trifolium pratense TaxID=57577 RepID=A0ACB0LYZ6_TRIPR|nr:unnamed protein product [Trifolium pratense]CAJ2673685.1 unnamed protein product [Trifolium pratense]
MTYVGAGMICSHLVNLSLFFGVVVSWGIMWPLIRVLKGSWFSESLPESSMKSLNGYKVFISIALILGDELYNFIKIIYFSAFLSSLYFLVLFPFSIMLMVFPLLMTFYI